MMYCPECEKITVKKIYRTIDLGCVLELEIYLCKECGWISVNDWWWTTEDQPTKEQPCG